MTDTEVQCGDVFQLTGPRVTSNEELLEAFQAHLGLQPGEQITKLSYDVPSNQWTVDYGPVVN